MKGRKIGEQKCKDMKCEYCPFRTEENIDICLNDDFKMELTLEEGLELAKVAGLITAEKYNLLALLMVQHYSTVGRPKEVK